MRSLLVFAVALLVIRTGPPAADAATINTPRPDKFTYPVMVGSPSGRRIGFFSITPDNATGNINWSISANCSKLFEVRPQSRFYALLFTKIDVPYFEKEKRYSCKLYVNESGSVATAPFSVVTVLQNYTFSFEKYVCPSLLHNASRLFCRYSGISLPNLVPFYKVNDTVCQLRTRTISSLEPITGFDMTVLVNHHIDLSGLLYTNITVDIAVVEVNDHSPSCSPRHSILTLPQDALVTGFQVSAFNCTDADSGKNGKMVCSTESSGFHANMTDRTCSLRLTAPFHPEPMTSRRRKAVILVRDNADPASAQRTATYTITVVAVDPIYPVVTSVGNNTAQAVAFSSDAKKQNRKVFDLSLAFTEPFDPKLENKTSPEFRAKAKIIEEELTRDYLARFPTATVLVVVARFKKGSTLAVCDVYFSTPAEIGPVDGLTVANIKEITREALKGGKLTLLKIDVKASGLSFVPLPVTAPAGVSYSNVQVEAATTELFQETFSDTSSKFYATVKSQFHQRISVGFSGAKNLRAVALNIKSLALDRRSSGTIVTFEVAFESLTPCTCSAHVLQDVVTSAIIRADFGVIRVKALCPKGIIVPLYAVILFAIGVLLLFIALIVVCWRRRVHSRKNKYFLKWITVKFDAPKQDDYNSQMKKN